jgi:hypothetical protein
MSALPALKNPIAHVTEQEYWEHDKLFTLSR